MFIANIISQKEGIDYDETFAPVSRYTSIRTILALASNMKWKLHQMDVKTVFLNGLIEEEVLNNHKVLRLMIIKLMYVDSRRHCMG